jgi:hypothetical protein
VGAAIVPKGNPKPAEAQSEDFAVWCFSGAAAVRSKIQDLYKNLKHVIIFNFNSI